MDQVPLPFVVNQEYTYTANEDSNIHITCPAEALRKRQFTMHVVVNAGIGEKREGYVDVVCKGGVKRLSLAEKNQWDGRVKVS